ncbi:hypothetical protein GGR56DRAFT_674432 [Xylariaceae sp. FL0804]|nr:hypothetical protein GGR56DRAFT_674432 [Xylariaceae sp. FL0804]
MPDTTQHTGKPDGSSQPTTAGEAVQGAKFAAHQAHPGPAVPENMPEEKGTKEERQAKAKELNK